MALIIDDGTFLVGNSFITLAEADAYHLIRNNDDWLELNGVTFTDLEREASLIRAFDYLSVQDWKSDAFDNGIPQRVKNAQCEGALKETRDPGSTQPDIQNGIKKEAIDDVVTIEYFDGAGSSATSYTIVDNLIEPYIRTTSSTRIRIVRGGG